MRCITNNVKRYENKLCKKLVRMTPNLEELSLSAWNSPINQEFVCAYLEEIIRLQSDWKYAESNDQIMPFKNLAFIKLHSRETGAAPTKMILNCFELLQPLRGIEIHVEAHNNHNVPLSIVEVIAHILQKLVQKHSKTLETLSISYDSYATAQRRDEGVIMYLPEMPKLTRLSLGVFKCKCIKKYLFKL
jgi:hypothetical protein